MRRIDRSDDGKPESGPGRAAPWPAVEEFLRARGAGEMPHPGGTLLDHLVLTVADIARTVGFYERVLDMRLLTFGEGRHALAFGTN